MPKMQIEYIPVDCIQPYERNAKKHTPEQVEQIANSIREFGFKQPLVVDAKNVLVIGHGRLMAAKLLEMVEVPCVRADDLTPEQIKALRLADNKLNESDWDMALLEIELADITELDMTDFGFDELIEDESAAEVDEVENVADPVDLLPESRLLAFSISAFGVLSETFIECILPAELGEKVASADPTLVSNAMMEALKSV